jgi:hypothetical protein
MRQSRRRVAIILIVVLVALVWAFANAVRVSWAVEEEDLPSGNAESGNGASPTSVSPAAAASPDSDGSDDWQRVPEGANEDNPPAGVPAASLQPVQSESKQAPPIASTGSSRERRAAATPVAAATPQPSSSVVPTTTPTATQLPIAVSTEAPPALDVSAMDLGGDVGQRSLASEIKHARSPSMAASLRLTEQARKELAKEAIDPALRDLARAVSIDPGNSIAYYYLGRAHFARRNYQQALIFFQRAQLGFGARPEWMGETLSYEGACDEELGRTLEAAKAYQQAVRVAPGNFRARIGYGRLSASLAPPGSLDAPPPSVQDAPMAPPGAVPPPPAESPAPQTQ